MFEGSPQMVLYTIIPKAASTTFFGLIKQVTLIQGRYHFNHFPSYKMLRHNDLLNEMPYVSNPMLKLSYSFEQSHL